MYIGGLREWVLCDLHWLGNRLRLLCACGRGEAVWEREWEECFSTMEAPTWRVRSLLSLPRIEWAKSMGVCVLHMGNKFQPLSILACHGHIPNRFGRFSFEMLRPRNDFIFVCQTPSTLCNTLSLVEQMLIRDVFYIGFKDVGWLVLLFGRVLKMLLLWLLCFGVIWKDFNDIGWFVLVCAKVLKMLFVFAVICNVFFDFC